jgi:predicted nucleic acid-binding protein
MPYVETYVDASAVIDEITDEELADEMMRRRKRRAEADAGTLPWTDTSLASDLRDAFYRRDASRMEALLMVLERPALIIPKAGYAVVSLPGLTRAGA